MSCCDKHNFLPWWTINDHSLISQVTFLVYPVHLANTLTSHSEQQLHAAFWLDWGLAVSSYSAWCNSFSPLRSSIQTVFLRALVLSRLCDSAVTFWVQEMRTRCQLDCVTEPCGGGLICGEGRQTDRQRNKQGAGDMGEPCQLFCLLSYAARPPGHRGKCARESVGTCVWHPMCVDTASYSDFFSFFEHLKGVKDGSVSNWLSFLTP